MMDKEEIIKYVGKINERIREKLKDDGVALEFYSHLVVCFNRICDESQKQKEAIDNIIEYIKENMYSYYDNNGEKCIEETVFERSANPKELLDILKEVSE